MEQLNKDGFYEKDGVFMMTKPAPVMRNFDNVVFRDLNEGRSYFICDTLMPAYLPEGYVFDRIGYATESAEEFAATRKGTSKYMNVYYNDGKNEIYSQVRYMDEDTAFGHSTASPDMKTITINGHHAVLAGKSLDILIGDVMYMFRANDQLSVDELVKMAKSLQ
jgi:hypothetical protein